MELKNAQPQEQAHQQPAAHCEKSQGHQAEDDDIFDEINNSYVADTVNRVNDVDRENPVVNVVTAADAELTLYKQVPPIKLKRDDGTFNCPLLWWKYNERKYKLLSILASQLLSIPATSAPSEIVFSVAGLTISKDRARLASDVANELVFLHDALPGVQKYYEAQNVQNVLY